MFRKLDLISVPEQRDVQRWIALGVDEARIRHTGSVKYDPADFLNDVNEARPPIFALRDPVLFGGSTHRGEEEALGQVFVRLRADFPTLRLFIAPRHVERVREVRHRLQGLGLTVALVSEPAPDGGAHPDCVLLDRTGELPRWYQIATVAFVGKSLTAHGGQNPVEPIAVGIPVLFGPHMENFVNLARELVEKKGAIQVADEGGLEDAVRVLLQDEQARRTLVSNAEQVLSEHRGATQRTAHLVHELRG